jgi:hypothetical protein
MPEPIPQGDTRLLETDRAQRLLTSTAFARLAYVWTDGTPRVVPIWFHWTGEEIVFGSRIGAHKVRALHVRPAVAVTIDTEDPPSALLLRGEAAISIHDHLLDEVAAAARRYLGADGGAAWIANYHQDPHALARIAVRPRWVGLLDFDQRMPESMGGVSG